MKKEYLNPTLTVDKFIVQSILETSVFYPGENELPLDPIFPKKSD